MSKKPIQPEDINRFMCPGDPQISSDGSRLVFTVQRADRQEDHQTTNLWIAPLNAGGQPRRLTTGDRDHSARWSPDGRTIAFVSGRSGRPQLWLMRADGGEPWQLPTEQSVAGPPEWSPDGRLLAFTARVFDRPDDWEPYPGAPPGDRERAASQARKEDAGDSGGGSSSRNGRSLPGAAQAGDRVSDVKVITRLRYRFDGTGYFGDRRSQVFVVAATGPGEAPGTARMVTGGDCDHLWPCWTAEGKLLAVASRRDDADLHIKQDLWLVDPDSGELTMVYRGAGPIAAPRVSPDGTKVAFLGHNSTHGPSTTMGLIVIPFRPAAGPDGLPLGPENGVSLLEKVDRPAGNPVSSDVRYAPQAQPPQWSEDSRHIYHLMGDHGTAYLVRLPVPALVSPEGPAGDDPGESGGGTIRPEILAGDAGRVVAGVSYSAGVLAYQAGTSVQPDEIYVQKPVPAAGSSGWQEAEWKVTDLNGPLLSELAISPAEKFAYRGADGWEIEGWLVRPTSPEPAPHPTVLSVHGGPHGVYGAAFMFQAQLLASDGFAVVYTNPRGSQTYGQEFASACVGDWGGKDYEDITAGLDQVISVGTADPERLGITGWSYGGYMTSWAITQTGRFRAAVAGAIIYNRHNFWGTSDIGYTFGHHHCGGTPWDEPELLLSRSAAKYTGRVSTPLLLLHGEGDLRCPIEQSEQFFVGLRFLGKTAVMARYPGEYHAFRKPSHKTDRYARTLAWFRYYLAPREEGR